MAVTDHSIRSHADRASRVKSLHSVVLWRQYVITTYFLDNDKLRTEIAYSVNKKLNHRDEINDLILIINKLLFKCDFL